MRFRPCEQIFTEKNHWVAQSEIDIQLVKVVIFALDDPPLMTKLAEKNKITLIKCQCI